MDERDLLAERFEAHRGRLTAAAYRMLGSASDADDAVQETWLRFRRADAAQIENLGGWLTTAVARASLDMLRSRRARREEPLEGAAAAQRPDGGHGASPGADPEREALMAESVGLALLVVLGRLSPAERVAFVLHETFGVPFDEIAGIVGRTPTAARQLASRARSRVHGASPEGNAADLSRQRDAVRAFLAALRAGDLDGLLAVLDPDVVVRLRPAAGQPAPEPTHGAETWAKGAVAYGHLARFTEAALVDGAVGAIWAPRGRLGRVLRFTFAGDRIAEMEIVTDPASVTRMEIGMLEG